MLIRNVLGASTCGMKACILVILTFWSVFVIAQTDSLRWVAVAPAIIESGRVHHNSGITQDLDTLLKCLPGASVGALLQFGSSVPLMTYGPPGNVISLNDRGLSSDHVLVSWHGVPLNSPSLGSTDLAMIPAALFNGIEHASGIASTAYSGGTGAGMIRLNNRTDDLGAFSISINDVRNASSVLRIPYHVGENLRLITAIQSTANANDFSYVDPYLLDAEEQRQHHNNFRQQALLNEVEWCLGKNMVASGGIWLQRSDLNIPGSFGELGQSFAQRSDTALRAFVQLKMDVSKNRWTLQLAQQKEWQRYTDRNVEDGPYIINSPIETRRRYVRGGFDQFRGGLKWGFSAEIDDQSARSKNYILANEWNSRRIIGLATYAHHRMGAWMVQLGSRFDQVAEISRLNGDFQVSRGFKNNELFVRVRSLFRYPDLNELFWIPGGRQDLKPEVGMASEIGASGRMALNRLTFRYQTLFYTQKMNSLIVWLPEEGVWQAQNREEVHAQGLEVNASVRTSRSQLLKELSMNGRLQFNSIDEEVLAIRYPSIYLRLRASVANNRWAFGVQSRFTSNDFTYRYLNSEEAHQDATLFNDIDLSYTVSTKFGNLNVGTLLLNVFDVLDHRATLVATPGRVVTLNLVWKWNSVKNEECVN